MVRVTRSKKVLITEDSTAIDQPLKPKLLTSNTLVDISSSRRNSQLVKSVASSSTEIKVNDKSSKKNLRGTRGTSLRSKLQDEPKSPVNSSQIGLRNNLDVWPKEDLKSSSQLLASSQDTKLEHLPQCIANTTNTDENGVTKSPTPIETSSNYSQPHFQGAQIWPIHNDLDKSKYQDTTNEDSVLESEEDSFIQQITSRSPAKPVLRVDDPVEALDQIEEALEVLDEVAKVELLVKRVRHPNHPTLRANNKPTVSPPKELNCLRRSKTMDNIVPRRNISEPKELPRKASRILVTKPNPGRGTISSKAADSSSSITTPVRPQHTQRRSTFQPTSTNPTKSTKPLTRPNFELPGEAVARKLRQKRENRIALRQSSSHGDKTVASNSKSGFPITKPQFPKTKPSKHQLRTSSINQESSEVSLRVTDISDHRSKGSTNTSTQRFSTSSTPSISHANRDHVNNEMSLTLNAVGNSSNGPTQRLPKTSPGRPTCAAPINLNTISVKPNLLLAGPQTSTTEFQSQQPTNNRVNKLTLHSSHPHLPELSCSSRDTKEMSNTVVSNARIEAAERGRQAILKWAEEQMIKR